MTRHSRQTRLAEVGDAGRARLAAGHAFIVADGLLGEVQARYLAGAGVGTLHVLHEGPARAAAQVDGDIVVNRDVDVDVDVNGDGDGDVETTMPSPSPPTMTSTTTETTASTTTVPEFGMRDGAARDVAAGAWLALCAIKNLLGLPRGSAP
jgi:hypothetical protein